MNDTIKNRKNTTRNSKRSYLGSCFSTLLLTLLFSWQVDTGHCDDLSENPRFLHGVKLGVLAHDVDGLWSGSSNEGGIDINCELAFAPSLELFSGNLRPVLGGSLNTQGDTSKLYLDGVWQYDWNSFFFSFGLGLAIHNGEERLVSDDKKALGSSVLFHIPIEIGYAISDVTSVSIYFDHISNGNTKDENEGLDTLGIRFGYLF